MIIYFEQIDCLQLKIHHEQDKKRKSMQFDNELFIKACFIQFIIKIIARGMNFKNCSLILFLFISALFINRSISSPLTAYQLASNLGKGFDVTWSEFSKYMKLYTSAAPNNFNLTGFKNVRIRMNDPAPNADFMKNLKQQVADCVTYGIYPIIAYQGFLVQSGNLTEQEATTHLKTWWTNMAQSFLGVSDTLSFNILIQISGKFKKESAIMNRIYQEVYNGVRSIDKTRIIIFPPVSLSDPEYLQQLQIPGTNDLYTMAQWHFYAAGPNPDLSSKKYWVDGSTWNERNGITDSINIACAWMSTTGYSTWVGAWMAGNYNKGNNFDLIGQIKFGSFMARKLAEKGIPWAINADNKFYDYANNVWFRTTSDAGGRPVLDAILDSQKIAVYQNTQYAGNGTRLGVGSYNSAQLSSLGITSIKSIMVPLDYQVILQSAQIITDGDVLAITQTTADLNNFSVALLKVEQVPFL